MKFTALCCVAGFVGFGLGLAVLDAMATTPRIQIVKARAVPALIDGPVEVVRP